MRKKVCPRPQCAKEYLEGEGFDDLTVCKLCGAPLEDVFVDDYDIEEQSDEFEENTDYETDDVICEDDMSYEEDIVDDNDIEDTEETFEDKNCFIDIDIVDDKLKSEVILAEEDVDSDENDDENIEENEAEDIVITEANEEDEEEEDELENTEEVNPYENIKGNNLILYKDNEIFKVYELKYDETIIGRNSSEFTPDIDLQEVDNENAISRKHLLVYKEDDKYYVRNLSKKCSVHIKRYDEDEPKVLSFNESVVIEDGDFIVLSGKFILEAYFNEVEE